jgi:tetratricopeptide (TPR) repeat protein
MKRTPPARSAPALARERRYESPDFAPRSFQEGCWRSLLHLSSPAWAGCDGVPRRGVAVVGLAASGDVYGRDGSSRFLVRRESAMSERNTNAVPASRMRRALSRRSSLLLVFLLSVVLLWMAGQNQFRGISGNLSLVTCAKSMIAGDLSPDSCSGRNGTTTQKNTMAYLRTLKAWRSQNYGELASKCAGTLCSCFPGKGAGSAVFHERLQAYYNVLSYRIQTGSFPELDSCVKSFVPSGFLVLSSSSVGSRDLSEMIWSLAYLVDSDWIDQYQRGRTAHRQGVKYLEQGDRSAAQRAFEVAVDSLRKANHEQAAAYASWSLQALGELALEQGDLQTAALRFRQSAEVSPRDSTGGFQGLLEIWSMQARGMDDMLRDLEETRQNMDVSNPFLTSGPALALFEIGASDAAWQFIHSAPQEVQNAASVLAVKGKLYESAGDSGRALQCYEEALVQTLETAPLEAAARSADLARLSESKGAIAQAVVHMERAVGLNPQSEWYLYRLALLYQQTGRSDKARQSLERALLLDPHNPSFLQAWSELNGQ